MSKQILERFSFRFFLIESILKGLYQDLIKNELSQGILVGTLVNWSDQADAITGINIGGVTANQEYAEALNGTGQRDLER